jgi:hypothetical protein
MIRRGDSEADADRNVGVLANPRHARSRDVGEARDALGAAAGGGAYEDVEKYLRGAKLY